MSNEQYIYHDINKPLNKYKRVVWYDDSKEINRLDELASILGLKEIKVCGEKDDESDIAIIKTNNAGDSLIIENCHIEIVLLDYHDFYQVKDSSGNKTRFKRGDKNVI